jgi:hypothetical protein
VGAVLLGTGALLVLGPLVAGLLSG